LAKAQSVSPAFLGECDVVIIGAGIIGAMIARELSKLKGKFALIEKEAFPGFGVSKASLSQIHLPDFCPIGSLKGKLSANAPQRFKKLARELDLHYREVGEIWLALKQEHIENLWEAKKRGESNGARGYEIIGPEKIRQLEPYVTKKAIAGLYAKEPGVLYTPEWTFALTENAVQNGVSLYLGAAVTGIDKEDDHYYKVTTTRGQIRARYVINAAGLYSDEIAALLGDADIHLELRKGTMLIFDKSVSSLVRHMLFGTFSEKHSQDIAPTAHGNLILWVHYVKPRNKKDTSVSRENIEETFKLGKELVPALREKDMITSFSGILCTNNKASDGDFYIAPSEHAPRAIHVLAGAPGLTAAPGIADMVIRLLVEQGLKAEEKKVFHTRKESFPRFESAPLSKKEKMIASNPKYAHIVCRCEQVTEAEVINAIKRGVDTMDGVKHLTRAGMGRCQGSFCGSSVLKYLANTLGIPATKVTKKGASSHHIVGYTKQGGESGAGEC